MNQPSLKPPSRLALVLETRALIDIISTPFTLIGSKLSTKQTEGTLPIIMFPGFGSDEGYLKALECYLSNLGYSTEGWGLGKNLAGMNYKHSLEDLSPTWEVDYPEDYSPESYKGEGGVAYLSDQAIARVKQRSQQLGSPVVVIGWSLGGVVARECARELPSEVAQVITFGTPIIGGPKYSRAADYFNKRGFDLDWIEASVEKRNSKPITQPITSIYSKSDAVVAYRSAIDTINPNVTNIEVSAAHLGMGFNRKIWKLVHQALRKEAMARVENH